MKKEVMTEETRQFLAEREQRFGGKIVWRAFSLFYGDSEGNIRENGVLVFQIGNTFYYEDFEKTQNNILGIKVEPKNKTEYVKFEGSFKAINVRGIDYVKRSDAINYIKGKTQKVRTVSAAARFFKEVVMSIEFEDGTMKFFEVSGSEFRQLIEMEINKYKWSKTVYDKENGLS